MKRIQTPLPILVVAFAMATVAAAVFGFGTNGNLQAAEVGPESAIETFFRLTNSTGHERLVRGSELAGLRDGTNGAIALFRAIKPSGWHRRLVPLYSVDTDGRTELRRLPGRGQENFSDPIFFALPPDTDGPEVERVTGRWEVRAIRADKSPAQFAWELAALNGRVAGRFEQLTDFRFAYLSGGTFRSNRLEFTVEYVADRYSIEGQWEAGRMKGTWRRHDDADSGTWEATRALSETPPLPTGPAVPLVSWMNTSKTAVRYTIGEARLDAGWERVSSPLCRVWMP